jgi:hypothetical protein
VLRYSNITSHVNILFVEINVLHRSISENLYITLQFTTCKVLPKTTAVFQHIWDKHSSYGHQVCDVVTLGVTLQKARHFSNTSVRVANPALNRVLQQMFVGIDFGVNSNKLLLCCWNLLLHHKYHHPVWFCTPCEPNSYYNPLPHSWLVGSFFGPCVWFWSLCVLLLTTFSQQPTHSLIYGLNRSTKCYVQWC